MIKKIQQRRPYLHRRCSHIVCLVESIVLFCLTYTCVFIIKTFIINVAEMHEKIPNKNRI